MLFSMCSSAPWLTGQLTAAWVNEVKSRLKFYITAQRTECSCMQKIFWFWFDWSLWIHWQALMQINLLIKANDFSNCYYLNEINACRVFNNVPLVIHPSTFTTLQWMSQLNRNTSTSSISGSPTTRSLNSSSRLLQKLSHSSVHIMFSQSSSY